MWKEFRDFLNRGNVLDLAIAVVLGAAFGKIVTAAVEGIIMPPIGMLLGNVDFSELFIDLSGKHHPNLAAAKADAAPVIMYGAFINSVVDFLIIAFVIFLLVRQVNRFKSRWAAEPVATRECPFCLSTIPMAAIRCAHCTVDLQRT
jgi:large conductance mechanosensitive channel